MEKPKILITGADGQLGSEFKVLSTAYPDFEFTFLSRKELSITDETAINDFFASLKPHYCVNCAAYTAVDRAESEKDLAFLVNGKAPGLLASASRTNGTKLIHISTDYVFNGNATEPYHEEDNVDPVNLYGQSKRMGEELVRESNAESIIIRTSWVYSSFGNNFVKTMMRLMKEREVLGVVNDQFGSPTYAADLAQAVMTIIGSGKWAPGIYHYSNEGSISWFDFAVEIRNLIHSPCQVNPISTSSYPTPAKRPGYSVFRKDKIKEVYEINIPSWEESLKGCIAKLN
jgi:dTDP-4-dehydrorhamnose reductase